MMMAFRINRAGGIYKEGSACSLSKRIQIIKSAILNGGNIAETTWENFLTYQGTKNRICNRNLMSLKKFSDVELHLAYNCDSHENELSDYLSSEGHSDGNLSKRLCRV